MYSVLSSRGPRRANARRSEARGRLEAELRDALLRLQDTEASAAAAAADAARQLAASEARRGPERRRYPRATSFRACWVVCTKIV